MIAKLSGAMSCKIFTSSAEDTTSFFLESCTLMQLLLCQDYSENGDEIFYQNLFLENKNIVD